MSSVVLAPMQWADLEDIDDVEPLNDADAECLADIRNVLREHGKLERFGITLLHSHFEVSEDEIMLESCDSQRRRLTTAPVKISESGENKVGTMWMLREGDATTMAWCKSYCYKTSFGRHTEHHRRVKD